MTLYQEIIFLKHYFKGNWVVENVIAYYDPLIIPQTLGRHWYWTNFYIHFLEVEADNINRGTPKEWEQKFGFDLSSYKGIDKRLVLRNCVTPQVGKHVLDCSLKEELSLFTPSP